MHPNRLVVVLAMLPGVLAGSPNLLCASATDPLPTTRIAALIAMSREFHARLLSHRPRRYFDILAGAVPVLKGIHDAPGTDLMFIDDRGQPIFYTVDNLNAARTIGTDAVWPGGITALDLDGAGTSSSELGIWDEHHVLESHQEVLGRLTNVLDDAGGAPTAEHSTHVAGTMIASGVDPNAKGMSPDASLKSYDWNDDSSEMALEAGLYMRISNHSYGENRGWGKTDTGDDIWLGDTSVSTNEDYRFGFYSDKAAEWDAIAWAAPYYTIVAAAGNDRDDAAPASGTLHYHTDGLTYTDTHDDDGGTSGYDTIQPTQTAKNIITVGAVEDLPGGWASAAGVSMPTYSAWGPTDDGRIKPDLVANGQFLYSCTDAADDAYGVLYGTSMASPSVAGSLNLLREQFQTLFGRNPLSSTLKAIAIQTADEAGAADGPDYEFGWGLMNTRHAAELIDADSRSPFRYIVEATLGNGETDEYRFHYTDSAPIKITLVWTDPAGTPVSASVDPLSSMLINDLDMRLYRADAGPEPIDYGYPWVLSPGAPSFPASQGDNSIDNVEQIVASPLSTDCYLLRVSHKGTLSGQQQAYSLVFSTPLTPCLTFGPVNPNLFEESFPYLVGNGKSCRSVGWVDLDSDDHLDVLAGVNGGGNLRARNLGGGVFDPSEPGALGAPGPHMALVAADEDNDGDVDVYEVNDGAANRLLRNDGPAGFVDVASGPLADTGPGRCAAWADFDGDGDLDLYLSNFGGDNRLLRNDGADQFTDVTPEVLRMPGNTTGVAWGDFDRDGDPDLFIANAGGLSRLTRNDGGGQFTDVTTGALAIPDASFGVAWGDVDNDGWLDLLVSREQAPHQLLHNDGAGQFTAVNDPALQSLGNGRHVGFGDMDNDGDLDILMVQQGSASRLLLNGPGGWSLFPDWPSYLQSGVSAALGDYNRDGTLDVLFVESAPADSNALLMNLGTIGHGWLEVRLVGQGSNRQGIGARVEVVTTDGTQVREISAGSGYMGQDAAIAHFGLGNASVVSAVRVRWPGGGQQKLHDILAGQLITVHENATVDVGSAPAGIIGDEAIRLDPCEPNPFTLRTSLSFAIGRPGSVRLEIFDLSGRMVRTLADGSFAAGRHRLSWDGLDESGRSVPNGTYFARLAAIGRVATRKVLRMK